MIFQIQYQLSFCLWVLAFNSDIAAKLNKFGVIPILADILTDAQKEKVSRIILAVFRVSEKNPSFLAAFSHDFTFIAELDRESGRSTSDQRELHLHGPVQSPQTARVHRTAQIRR